VSFNGVDVSGWQPDIDTYSLTADFVIIKSTEGIQGTRYNPDYRRMADRAFDSGKMVGFYHYANGGDPNAEAECFYESIRDYRGRVTYTLDWEGQGNRTFETGEDVRWCHQFMVRMDELMGGKCMLYTSKGVCLEYDWSEVADHPLWGAEYAYDDYTYQGYQAEPWQSNLRWGAWGHGVSIHQYGFVNPKPNNGGYAKLDADLMFGTAADWDAWCGSKNPSPAKPVGRRKASLADIAATIHYDMCVDETNGYSQAPYRWGGDSPHGTKTVELCGRRYTYKRGSYDCSSSVITAWKLALQGTPYEGRLDSATYTGDMREVFVNSGLFTAEFRGRWHSAKRGDVYLNEGVHTAMCQDGGSDGVLNYDALSEFNRNELHGATYGEVGDQDGHESVVRGYYDDNWDCVLYYNGNGDFYVDEDDEGAEYEQEDTVMRPIFVRFDGDPTEMIFNPWSGSLRAVANQDEKTAAIKLYGLAGVEMDAKVYDFGSESAPWGARANDALSRGASFKGFERYTKHPSTRAIVKDELEKALSKTPVARLEKVEEQA
jgi:hypothetical protein